MVTQQREQQQNVLEPSGIGQRIWFWSMPAVTLALMALVLVWAPTPTPSQQALFTLLIVALLGIACFPRLRAGEIAASFCGLGLAAACWLSSMHLWEHPVFAGAYIPLAAPVVCAIALVCAVWGVVLRVRPLVTSRLAVGALIGGLAILLFDLLFFVLINHTPAMQSRYLIESYQPQEMAAVALLYPLALWQGGVGARRQLRLPVLPLGMAAVMATYLIWHMR